MANIQDISFQLMKSPRELASWNFPLSEILEEYFNLLPEPCNIHYGEAALVIQNSVNAYVRRVEELYDETRCLSRKIILESKDDDRNKKDSKSKKCLFDFSHFELLDFDKEIGKNIVLKNHEEKSMKFLHRYFSQLANSHARLRMEVLDIQGEIIGKKYDFRCNQRMTRSGTLVEEFTPKDFEDNSVLENHVYSSSPSLNENLDYFSTELDESEPIGESVFSTEIEKVTSENHQNKLQIDKHNQIGFEMFNECHTVNDRSEFCSIESKLVNISCKSDLLNTDTENIENNTVIYSDRQNQNTENISRTDYTANSENTIKNRFKRKSFHHNDSNIADVQCTLTLRRSKRFKEMRNIANACTLNHVKLLKPIPFEEGIPEKLIKNRAEFRLPCHISLLKHNSKKRKYIKMRSKITKRVSKSKNDQNEPESTNFKMTVYSPSRPQFITLKEEDQRGFEESVDERFTNKEHFVVNYKPVTTLTMDLLGFQPKYAKDDSQIILTKKGSILQCSSNHSSPHCTPSPSPPPDFIQQIFSREYYIASRKDNYEKDKICIKYGCDFEKAVKYKINKIYKELDLQTDDDQKVAKWHEEIKPRLIEAQRKPPFQIHEYETRIIRRLETSRRKLQFDEILREEPPCEVARYFSATLHLASTNNLNINATEEPNRSIELVLLD